ncbi:MAG: glycosyltransferase family 4 protein, partial [Cyanobacteriota bacterium]|nr:glycosyltransferase family 4 protein [Cyanobacteriota bacterium]
SVEVFAAGLPGEEPANAFGVEVHRIDAKDRAAFREQLLPVFAERHAIACFDLVESPEIGAEGARIAAAFPEVAVISKLHTPSYLVGAIGHETPTLQERLRFRLGALRRGRWAGLRQQPYIREQDPERQFTRHADGIDAPSQAIAERLTADWDLDPEKLSVYGLPFRPEPAFLGLPVPSQVCTIGFLGRLEARKGVVELARAIPRILQQAPQLQFRFLGPSWPYRNSDMERWIRHHCRSVLDRIVFVGAVAREQLAVELAQCDGIVLPSRWENFPFACWEAMASGRAVIGSSAGGMADVIEPGVSGLLVPPHSPEAITAAVLSLVEHPERVTQLGGAGRRRVLEHLAPERILPLQLASYERAIARARQRR